MKALFFTLLKVLCQVNESNSYSLKDQVFEVNALELKSNITLDHNQIEKILGCS